MFGFISTFFDFNSNPARFFPIFRSLDDSIFERIGSVYFEWRVINLERKLI